MKKLKCSTCNSMKATYECEECGDAFCIDCAAEEDFEHECIDVPRIVRIKEDKA